MSVKGEEDGSWNKIFMEIFRSMLHVFFFCVFLLSLTGLSSFWHGLKDIFTLYKLAADKVGLDHYKWLRQKR